MKNIFARLFICMLLCSIFISCKKSETSSSFTWTFDETTSSAITSKAFIHSMAPGPYIVGSTTGSVRVSNNGVQILISSFNVGSYNLPVGTTYTLIYADKLGDEWAATSGTINITYSANNLLSGNFSGTVINVSGDFKTITGSFTNISVEP